MARPRSDLVAVLLATVISAAVSVRFEMSESLLSWLRMREAFEMDELPGVLLVLTIGLLWFALRRYRDLARVLIARQRAEASLARQLERNRQLHHALAQVQEAERRNLARELHDELGQHLGILGFDLHAFSEFAADAPQQERDALFARARHNLDHLQATVRDLIRRLRPVALDELGLAAALEELVGSWRQRLVDARIVLECPKLGEPGDAIAVAVFRIVQEALNNVARHSRAGLVSIRIGTAHDPDTGLPWLDLRVCDDGIGFDPGAPPRGGLGLISIAERAEALGGRCEWRTAPGDGFGLSVQIPLPAAGSEHDWAPGCGATAAPAAARAPASATRIGAR